LIAKPNYEDVNATYKQIETLKNSFNHSSSAQTINFPMNKLVEQLKEISKIETKSKINSFSFEKINLFTMRNFSTAQDQTNDRISNCSFSYLSSQAKNNVSSCENNNGDMNLINNSLLLYQQIMKNQEYLSRLTSILSHHK